VFTFLIPNILKMAKMREFRTIDSARKVIDSSLLAKIVIWQSKCINK